MSAADDYINKRKKDLGITPDAAKKTPEDVDKYIESRKRELKLTPSPEPDFANNPNHPTYNLLQTPTLQEVSRAKPAEPKKWNGLLDNPISRGLGKALDYGLVKPGQTIAAGIADTAGAINNKLAPSKVGYNGEKILPSEKRNLLKDVKDIWTNKPMDHSPLEGAAPNDFIRPLPGTGVTLGDVEDTVLQNIAPTKLATAPLSLASKGIKGAKNILKTAELPTSGFSALPAKTAQKLARPAEVEDIGQLIDVGGHTDKAPTTLKQKFEQAYTAMVDEQRPLRTATEKIGGKDVPTELNPADQAWLSRGWKGKADARLQYGFLDDQGAKVGNSLEDVLKPLGGNLDPLRKYAVALRSLEYERDGLESGISREIAEKAILEHGTPEVKAAYDNFKNYINEMNQDTLVKSGIMSQAKLDSLVAEHPNYVPMFRTKAKTIRDLPQSASNKRFGNIKSPLKKRTGSNSIVVDPIESVIKQTYKNTALAEKANVMRTMYDLVAKNPENGLITEYKASKAATEDVEKKLTDFIMNPSDNVEQQLKETLDLFKPQKIDGANVFTVMIDGKPKQLQVHDDLLAKTIAGLNNESVGTLANLLGKPTGLLKAGLVLTPDFVIKNLVRDQMSAFINSKYNYIPIWDMFSGLSNVLKAKFGMKDDIYYKWLASGGANGAWVSLERNYLQGQIRNLTQSDMKKISKNPIEWLRQASEVSEQSTRLGEFKRGLKKGASLQEAALASRDVTLDFSRTGSQTKGINKAVAFFNVAVQSIDKMARQFKKYPAQTTAKALTSITLPSVLLYLTNYKNPKYQEIPQWEKDAYWHIPVGDGFAKIPKPFEMGIIFGTLPERTMQSVMLEDPQAFEGYAKTALEGFSPSVVPALFMPWIEAYGNKKNFTGSPIVPKREENLLPEDQVGPYTSQIGRGIGKITNTSPRIVDNYITGYTGTLGKTALSAVDSALEKSGRVNLPAKPDQGLADIPGIRPFVSKGLEGGSKSVDEFYAEKDRLTKRVASAKKNLTATKDIGKLKMYDRISKNMSQEQAIIRDTLNDMKMTPEEKRDRIEGANLRIINLARQAKGLQPIGR